MDINREVFNYPELGPFFFKMGFYERVLCGCDCAQRILSIFENEYPDNVRLHQLLHQSRQCVERQGTIDDFFDLGTVGHQYIDDITISWNIGAHPVDYPSEVWTTVSIAYGVEGGVNIAAWAARIARGINNLTEEKSWQLERAMYYVSRNES